jgi:hypothetical protein
MVLNTPRRFDSSAEAEESDYSDSKKYLFEEAYVNYDNGRGEYVTISSPFLCLS